MRRLSSFTHEELHAVETASEETGILPETLLYIIRTGDWSHLSEAQAVVLHEFLDGMRVHAKAHRIYDRIMGDGTNERST